MVTIAVFRPILAHARDASQPAWPAPITITSYCADRVCTCISNPVIVEVSGGKRRYQPFYRVGDNPLNILVIGGGGREHAIAWRLSRSTSVKKLWATPGNPGIAEVAECVPCTMEPAGLVALASSLAADLTVVGPEAPLVAGVVDAFRGAGLKIVGPTQKAAQLEGSKIFCKDFLRENRIPTARYSATFDFEFAQRAAGAFDYPIVLKADGLAAGKGVVICHSHEEAVFVLRAMFSGELVGRAGSRVVIEEFLTGEEVSFIVLTDGRNAVPLQPTQDHKAIHDNDQGPNTGGMGAYCDSRILTDAMTACVMDTVIYPTLEGMRERGIPFTGFLYAGLMMTAEGPKVLEFNVRCGDPETQALMHRIEGDFAEVLDACAAGDLSGAAINWRPDPSVCVVVAAEGYPGKPRTGDTITGVEAANATGATVFQAGTKMTAAGLETAGGRVLGVTASGATLAAAIDNAYAGVAKIDFPGKQFRTDIGRKGLKRW
jgi:phosphoribosylamine--glycine ligase